VINYYPTLGIIHLVLDYFIIQPELPLDGLLPQYASTVSFILLSIYQSTLGPLL